jgi:hypothetical protein
MSVYAFYVVILFFEWPYHFLGVEFWKKKKNSIADESRMV